MSGSTFGKIFTVTTWGESHGAGLGAVIDGCPAGLVLTAEDINRALQRRRPGQSALTTPRREADRAVILSGLFDDRTTGTPISVAVYNENQRSKDYGHLKNCYRPAHADFTFDKKYGHRDYRGGGRSSGRETIGRVIGGAVAAKLLSCFGIQTDAYTAATGHITIPPDEVDLSLRDTNALYMPHPLAAEAEAAVLAAAKAGDSMGGIVRCRTLNIPTGLGEPVFRKLDALLGQALFSIGGVKAVEIGIGTGASTCRGSDCNDAFVLRDNRIRTATNHAGGVLGGIADGEPLEVSVHFKPTPSISQPQRTVRTDGTPMELSVTGRHDPVIFPRAVVVVESMVNLVLADLLLEQATARLDNLKKIFPV
ncbi:MAG: chorismate synthase [Eubacteriales bacterium]|nr:chorismate synthase [Eubacteriales bacterium]